MANRAVSRLLDVMRSDSTPAPLSTESTRLVKRLLVLQVVIGVVATALLVWELGWRFSVKQTVFAEVITWFLVLLALIAEVGLAWKDRRQSRLKRFLVLALLIVLALGRFGIERPLREWLGVFISPRSAALIALVVVQASLVFPSILRALSLTKTAVLQSARPGTLFVGSFALAIVVGTLMLKTPLATTEGISWLDAFFTSTSAICVTGLIVVDTELAFTHQGQVIILLMIQAGGLGIMTLTYFMSLILGEGITLRDSAKLSELFSEDNISQMGSFVAKIVFLTVLVEAAGAFLIHLSWMDTVPVAGRGRELWASVFHSVSAFCNAGFSIFSNGLAEPGIAENRSLQVVIMALVIVGGLGFAVLHDLPRLLLRSSGRLLKRFFPRSRGVARFYLHQNIRLHTRIALLTTLVLLVGGAVLFFLVEGWSFSGTRIWEAVFNSVTARTAGFNITDFSGYGLAAVVLLCLLMFIGGSPGGTAGGVKTTTFAVSLFELGRLVSGHSSLHLRDRRVPRDIVDRCSATIVLSLLWVACSIFVISWSNPQLDPVDIAFECFSAFGTVGITRGITPELNVIGKLVIIASMFAGRIGLLTLALTIFGVRKPRRYELPDARFPLN